MVPAQLELEIDPRLDGGKPALVQLDRLGLEEPPAHSAQCRPPPEREGTRERLRRARQFAAGAQRLRVDYGFGEHLRVELPGRHTQAVTRRPGHNGLTEPVLRQAR